jgi:hypothetical protein
MMEKISSLNSFSRHSAQKISLKVTKRKQTNTQKLTGGLLLINGFVVLEATEAELHASANMTWSMLEEAFFVKEACVSIDRFQL